LRDKKGDAGNKMKDIPRDKIFVGKIVDLVKLGHYGFIKSDDPELGKVFFHSDYLIDVAYKNLRFGDRVSFRVDTDTRDRIGARDVRGTTADTLMPYKNLQLGYASAEQESAMCPQLLLEGFLDEEKFAHELSFGSRFLVLGDKGSGKSALAQHIRLTAERKSNIFVRTVYLSDFPFVNFAKIINTDELPASRYPTAWSWILLLYVLDSFRSDQGSPTGSDDDFLHAVEFLSKLGLIPSPELKHLVNISTKAEFKLKLTPFFEAKKTIMSPNIKEPVPFLVEKLLGLISRFRSQSKHLLFVDGLDDILTFEDIQYEALAALLSETNRLNTCFHQSGTPAKIILLCRTDLFERLPGPNKNKIRQDSSILLDWYGSESDPMETKLVKLANRRARLSDRSIVNLFHEYFQKSYRNGSLIGFLLNYTRHNPRDFIQLLKAIQRHETSVRVDSKSIGEALADYSENYFLPEIRDILDGFIDKRDIDLVFRLLGAQGKRTFYFSSLKKFVRAIPKYRSLDLDTILDGLFECGVIGNRISNASSKSYTRFKYRNRNSVLNYRDEIIIQGALWLAFKMQHGIPSSKPEILDG